MPQSADYVAAVINSAVGASKVHLSLYNGTGGGLVLRIHRIVVTNNLTAVNTGTATTFHAMRTTAAGTGTAVTVRKLNTSAPALPSTISMFSNVTVTPTVDSEFAAATIYTEETTGQTPNVPLFQADACVPPITLRKGQGIAVRQSALASAGAVNVLIYFSADKE